MHVLLTGVSSFIGRHLAAHFLRAGLRLTATHRSNYPWLERLRGLGGVLDLVQVDLADADAASRLPPSVDAVVHVAALSTAPAKSTDDVFRCNVVGTDNVFRYALAAGAGRVLFASTLSVHGRIAERVVDEAAPIRDPDFYGASKYLGERLFAEVADRLPAVAIRLPGVLGPGAHRAWIPTVLERARAGQEIAIHNPDAAFNNAAHVDDLGPLFLGLLEREHSGYAAAPVGAAGMLTVRRAVERLIAAIGSSSAIRVYASDRPNFTVSSAYAIEHFGYRPMEIGAMLDRYAAQPDFHCL